MPSPLKAGTLGLGLLVWLALGLAAAQPYRDAGLPTEARVADLLERMTLEEKVGQMTMIDVARLMGTGEWDRGPLNETWVRRVLLERHVGALLSGGGAAPVPNDPESWAEMTNALQRYAVQQTRLGIPLLYGVDAVHGHNNVLGATLYPHNLGLAAAFDPELLERVAEKTARDVRATGVHWNFAPVADLGRDPRWGRYYETFGEDVLLASELVAASVRGLQASGEVAATLKHFLGYSQPLTGRDRDPAFLDPRSLRALHLPPFVSGLAAGARTVMANSGSVNGVPVHASHELLTDLLREELEFGGVLVSDWNDIDKLVSVHRVAADFGEAVAMSVNAGVDMYMVPHDAETFTGTLLALVREGRVSEARIDEAVRRILTLKLELGLFESPYAEVADAAGLVEEERALAREAALAGLTLLENDGVLPLDEGERVLLVGPGADDLSMQLGGWSIGWQGADGAEGLPPGTTVLEGLRAALGERLSYLSDVRDAAAVTEAAQRADAVVVVLGEEPYAEGAGDSPTLELPPAQLELLRTVAAADTPFVVVLLAGRPLLIPDDIWLELSGLIMAYLPGSEGGSALAQALLGLAEPAGRLPFSWPRNVGQLPLTYDALPGVSEAEPRYRFGEGFGYTRFETSRFEAKVQDRSVVVTLELANTGERTGSEVVQLYLERPPLPVMTPERQLVGFEKVRLEPGETRALRLELPLARFAVLPGDVFGSAPAEALPGSYRLWLEGRSLTLELP